MFRDLEVAGRYREALVAVEAQRPVGYRDVVADEHATDRGRLLWRMARFVEAERVLELAYADRCERLGEDHPDTLETAQRLAAVAHYDGRCDVARARFEAVVERYEGELGLRDVRTAIAQRNYAAFLRDVNDESADAILASAMRMIMRTQGRGSPEHVAALKVEALLVLRQGNPKHARTLAVDAVEIATAAHGAEHPLTAGAQLTLAAVQIERGFPLQAITIARRAAESFEAGYGRHPLVGLAFDREAAAQVVAKDLDAAVKALRAAARHYHATYPELLLPAFAEVCRALISDRRDGVALGLLNEASARPLTEDDRSLVRSLRAVCV